LMEKFDHAKQIERANEFETVDKVTILSHVAYRHIVNSETTDTEILHETVLDTIKSVMERLSRPSEKRQKMLDEIVQNTELLVDLPPDHYKFPHRTFMEYFAANYFQEEGKIDELLLLYSADKGKWQETLALFCGLNLNEAIAKKSLDALEGHFDSTGNDMLVFRALVESAKIRPEWAAPLLKKAEAYLKTNFSYELIEYLGYIGANPNLTYAHEATAILTNKLNHGLSNEEVTALLIALSANRSGNADELIKQYFENITLDGFYEFLKHDTRNIVSIMQYFHAAKLEEFIKVAAQNSDIPALLSILKSASDQNVKSECALAIANISRENSRLFYESLNTSGDFHTSRTETETINLFEDWNWEHRRPMSDNGKKLMALLAHYLVWLAKSKGDFGSRYRINSTTYLLDYYTNALSSKLNAKAYQILLSYQLFFIPFSMMKICWNMRRKISIDLALVFSLILLSVGISPVFLLFYCLNWYLVLLVLMTLIILYLFINDKKFSFSRGLNFQGILIVMCSNFILTYRFLKIYFKRINRFLALSIGCSCCMLHLIYVNSLSLPEWISIIYNSYYIGVFAIFNVIETGILGFIIPPLLLFDQLYDDKKEK